MRAAAKNYLPAIACALVPILCYLVTWPRAEIGINDDWSYIKSAQVLAETGRIAYNGWNTAMLGWQLYGGALFVKLFGFSFSAVRFCTVVEAMATAFLLQRTFLRAGINSRNAALATIAFILSPAYLEFAFVFLTDVSGILCIVVCLYMCLRALQAKSERFAMLWISSAALLNALGGTARQIVWFGVLVMIPCTLWLLRKSRRVVVTGCLSCIAGAVFIAAAMHWYSAQPYTIPESPFAEIPARGAYEYLKNLGRVVLGSAGVLAMFALPVLLMFAGALRAYRRLAAGAASVLAIAPIHLLRIDKWPARSAWDQINYPAFERLNQTVAQGVHLGLAHNGIRFLLTGAAAFGMACLVSCLLPGTRRPAARQPPVSAISWRQLAAILGPFVAVYILLVAARDAFYGRYFAPLLAIVLLVLVRFYQERVNAALPRACVPLIALFAAFALVAIHDGFAEYRAYARAIGEIQSSGAPATAILGPPEAEAWAQIDKVGDMNNPAQSPKTAYAPQPVIQVPPQCDQDLYIMIRLGLTPEIKPAFAVSHNPAECGGKVAFPAVKYVTVIPPRVNSIYPVRLSASFSN